MKESRILKETEGGNLEVNELQKGWDTKSENKLYLNAWLTPKLCMHEKTPGSLEKK